MLYVTFLLLCSTALAQTSAINGKILDEFGAPVSGAMVQATSAGKQEFKATSTATGEYTIVGLPAGSYDVTVTMVAMNPYKKRSLTVAAGSAVRIDVTLTTADGITLGTVGDLDRYSLVQQEAVRKTPPPDGPLPRLQDGKPDLSGFWRLQSADPSQADRPAPVQPRRWAAEVLRERLASNSRDHPYSRCLPNSISAWAGSGRFVHTPSLLVMLGTGEPPRQIFIDGRPHPKDLNPTWLGHSVGHWDGDTLVVDTVGFNGLVWLGNGLPATEMLHITERYRRPDLGHLLLEMTIDDPASLERPWIQKRVAHLNLTEDVEEFLCNENEQDQQHMMGK